MNAFNRFLAATIDPPLWWFSFVDVTCLFLSLVGLWSARAEHCGEDPMTIFGQCFSEPLFLFYVACTILSLFFLVTRSSAKLYAWLLKKTRLYLVALALRGGA